jgi:hypothetical protein
MYDIFISYTSADRPFAELVERDLKRRSYSVFLDRNALRAGAGWDVQLRGAVRNSKHLIVVWSDRNAAGSQWVTDEMATFAARQLEPELPAGTAGKMIQVCLEGYNKPHSNLQAITDLADAKVYPPGVSAGDAVANLDGSELWNRVLRKLDNVLEVDRDWTVVSYVLLAARRAEIEAVPPASKPWTFADAFADVVRKFGLTLPALPPRYGAARSDWRPLDGKREIEMLLDELRVEAIDSRKVPPFRWKEIGADLWSADFNTAQSAAEEIILLEEPCLILVDPLSLYSQSVREVAARLLRQAVANQLVACAVLPPFVSSEISALRDFLMKAATEELHRIVYVSPQLPFPNCNMMTTDPFDLKRLIGQALALSGKPALKAAALRTK